MGINCGLKCNCHFFWSYAACTEDPPCGEPCGTSPCHYIVMSRCAVFQASQTDSVNFGFNTVLTRDCLFEQTWSARGQCTESGAVGGGGGGIIIAPPDCDGVSRGNWPTEICDGERVTYEAGCNTNGISVPSVCGNSGEGYIPCSWNDGFCGEAGTRFGEHQGCVADASGYIMTMQLTTTTLLGGSGVHGELTVFSVNCTTGEKQRMVVYSSHMIQDGENLGFGCLSATTFARAGAPSVTINGELLTKHPLFDRFPKYICIAPYATHWRHFCDSGISACNCKDLGWDVLPLTFYIHCNDHLITNDTTVLSNTAFDMARTCGPYTGGVWDYVTPPTSPCCIFTGIHTAQCEEPTPKQVFYMAWCDGSEWKFQVWCLDYNGIAFTAGTMIYDGDLPRGEDCDCVFPDLEITTSGECCEPCEEPITSVCCATPIPLTLFATLASAGCSNLNGVVVTLNYAGTIGAGASLQHAWTGTFSAAGCGTLTFTFAIYVASPCEYDMAITSGATTYWGGLDVGIAPLAAECPVTSISHTANFGLFIGCCVLQSLTATVTP